MTVRSVGGRRLIGKRPPSRRLSRDQDRNPCPHDGRRPPLTFAPAQRHKSGRLGKERERVGGSPPRAAAPAAGREFAGLNLRLVEPNSTVSGLTRRCVAAS